MKTIYTIYLISLITMLSCDKNKSTVESEIPPKDTSAKIVFTMIDEDSRTNQIYRMNIDGSDLTQLTFNHEILDSSYEHGWSSSRNPTWSSDGKKIIYTRIVGTDAEHAVIMDEDGKNKKIITYGRGYTAFAMWSPWDNSILMDCDNSCITNSTFQLVDTLGNRHEVPFPEYPFILNGDSIYLVTSDIGWPPDGYSIFRMGKYKKPDSYYYCSEDSTAEIFRLDLITGNLVERVTYNNISECNFHLSPDGQILLFNRGAYSIDYRIHIMGINDSVSVPITNGTLDDKPNWSNRNDVIIYLQDIDPERSNIDERISIINIYEPFNPKIVLDKTVYYSADLYFNN